jgi:hypothetical protein
VKVSTKGVRKVTIQAIVKVGTTTAQACIDSAAEAGADRDVIVMRVGVLEFLAAHVADLQAGGDDAALLDAYKAWLNIAIAVYSTGEESLVGVYETRARALEQEMERAGSLAAGSAAES